MKNPQPTRLLLTLLFLFSTALCAQAQKKDSLSKKMPVDTLETQQPVAMTKELTDEELGIFTKVDIAAKVNMVQWRRHLEKNLLAPIVTAAKRGMKAGYYTVSVRFLVEKDGSLSGIKALNNPGYGLAEASEKVVKTGPKWLPGEQNGKKVRSFHTQPITFVISEK